MTNDNDSARRRNVPVANDPFLNPEPIAYLAQSHWLKDLSKHNIYLAMHVLKRGLIILYLHNNVKPVQALAYDRNAQLQTFSPKPGRTAQVLQYFIFNYSICDAILLTNNLLYIFAFKSDVYSLHATSPDDSRVIDYISYLFLIIGFNAYWALHVFVVWQHQSVNPIFILSARSLPRAVFTAAVSDCKFANKNRGRILGEQEKN